MTIEEYRTRYIETMINNAGLEESEAAECFAAIPEESLTEWVPLGDPEGDALTELSYWEP